MDPRLAIVPDGTPAAVTNAATRFFFRFGEPVTGSEAADGRVAGGSAGPLMADGDGRGFWMTVTPPSGVASGRMTVTVGAAAAADAAGNPSTTASAGQDDDTLAPTQRLTLFRVTDDVAPNTGNRVSGATTNDRTPTLTRTDGTLAPGAYAYTASIVDAVGNTTVLDLNGSAAGTAFGIVVI